MRVTVKGTITGMDRRDTPWGEQVRIRVQPLEGSSFWVTCPKVWAGKDNEGTYAKDLCRLAKIIHLRVTFDEEGTATRPTVV